MTTYADPTRCPDCRATLPHAPQICPACSLPLTGATVVSLFTTLQEADRLLGILRLERRPAAAPSTAAAVSTPGFTPAPRVQGTSVPKILLSLGALCLLVAAVTFLAVAWGWLGVGGRTAVLVALTGTALGLSAALHGRNLRVAAESLSVVGLGLLALDVVGVRRAGWVGPVDDSGLLLLTGAAVAAGALLMLAVTSRRPLVSPALIAPVAVLVACIGAQADVVSLVPSVMTVLVLLCLTRFGVELPSRPLHVAALTSACLAWVSLVLEAVAALEIDSPVTVAHYVGHLAGWPMLAATALAAIAGPVIGNRRTEALAGYAAAGLVGSYTLLMPVLDNEPTAVVSAVLAVSVGWVVVLAVAPARLRPAAVLPLAGTLVVPAVAALELGAAAASALRVGEPFTQGFGVHVLPEPTAFSPLLLAPVLVTVAAAGAAVGRMSRRTAAWAVAGAALLGGIVTLPLYDVPVAVVVGVLLAVAAAGLLGAERTSGAADGLRAGALVATVVAVLVALPSDRMTTGTLVVACSMAALLMFRGDTSGAVASLCFPVAFSGLVWAAGSVCHVQQDLRSLPVLVGLGALAIWRPRLELETASTVAATVVSGAAIAAARDVDLALAVHLTIAGMLVTSTSILHPRRRLLAWPGGLLLAAATWVRLVELGVHAPEAYTLPSAVVLVAVGVWRLSRDDASATLRYLAPGLTLATVPSLLVALHEPSSLRALLLGLACLTLALGGATLRWSAPLLVGAGVGGVLVLRELAPYAAYVPTWVSIGLSGALLLAAGITWESRLHDVRRAGRYVAALR